MCVASKYWKLVRIDATGRCKEEEIAAAKAFFYQQFPETIDRSEIEDSSWQRQLWDLMRQDGEKSDRATISLAETCLRCFISHQIEKSCSQLEHQFGSEYGFRRSELFPFVLDDYSVLPQTGKIGGSTNYKSLASQILHTFDPQQSSLSTWTNRMVKSHRDLNAFLLERGIYLISDWAILNDTNPHQLQRILTDFYGWTAVEIQKACILLESYHAVYRRDRLKMRLNKVPPGESNRCDRLPSRSRCQPPLDSQLQEIARYFRVQANLNIEVENILEQLQSLAENIRKYRIFAKRGFPKNESFDASNNSLLAVSSQSINADNLEEEKDEKSEFLVFYRTAFRDCLERAVQQVIDDRFTRLQRQNNQVAKHFILALCLFHCQGRSMGEIAAVVGLQAQYQVTRLLKLKEFRADVRQQMLNLLRDCIVDKAKVYAAPALLQDLEGEIESFLDEQISQAIQQAEAEASTAKKSNLKSVFTKTICRYLKTEKFAFILDSN